MVPKYPFCVEVTTKVGPARNVQNRSFETLPAAAHYADKEQRRPSVIRVRLLAFLDDWTKTEVEHEHS